MPSDASYVVSDLSYEEIQAILYFRIAAHLRRENLLPEAETYFKKAEELAPLDFTIVRASMPLRGKNPFGQEFFDLYQKYQEAGSPYDGIPRRKNLNLSN